MPYIKLLTDDDKVFTVQTGEFDYRPMYLTVIV